MPKADRSRFPQPGLGRVGASGSAAAAWSHYDGARKHCEGEVPEEAGVIGPTHDALMSRGGIYPDTEETAGSHITHNMGQRRSRE